MGGRRRPVVTAVAVTLAMVVQAACTDDGKRRDSSSATTTSAPSAATPASSVAKVDEGRLQSTLAALVEPRVTPEEREKARRFLVDQLRDVGASVVEERFGEDGVNVIGTIDGSDPTREAILLSAHYDTVPGAPGADDDGSGVVAVLEAARVLASAGLDAPIEIALFDLEERGLLGSRHHITTSPKIAAGFNLDMVGYSCHTPGCQVVFPDIAGCLDSEGSSDVGEGIAAVADADASEVLDAFVAARDEHVPGLHVGTGRLAGDGTCLEDARRSDHAPYWDAGKAVVFLTDTANFRNPNYHRPSDDLSTIDFALVADVTRALVGAVAELGGAS